MARTTEAQATMSRRSVSRSTASRGPREASPGRRRRASVKADATPVKEDRAVVPSSPASPPRAMSSARRAAADGDMTPGSASKAGGNAVIHPYLEEAESPFQWLYKPHTLTGLFFGLGLLLYHAFVLPETDDVLQRSRRGVFLASIIFLVYCSIHLRDSMMLRPHPIFWRVVHGCGILYLLGLSFLLAFPPDDARAMMRVLAPNIDGKPPPHNSASYAGDCRVYTPGHPGGPFAKVAECIDIFVVAHTVGWFGKALLLRDWRLGWLLSLLWELIEITFQKILPNFAECWWDHYIIDVLLSNGAGLVLGMWAVRWLNLNPYDWTGRDKKHPVPMDPLKQGAMLARQFMPAEFVAYEWKLVENARHLFAAVLLVVLMELTELNAFFLKYVLYMPPETPLNAYRLCFWFLLSLPATREYYAYATDSAVNRLGPNAWLSIVLMTVETMVCVKFARSTQFPADAGLELVVLQCWAVAGGAFLVWCVLKYNPGIDRYSLLGRYRATVMNLLITTAIAALGYLAYSQDKGYGTEPARNAGGAHA